MDIKCQTLHHITDVSKIANHNLNLPKSLTHVNLFNLFNLFNPSNPSNLFNPQTSSTPSTLLPQPLPILSFSSNLPHARFLHRTDSIL